MKYCKVTNNLIINPGYSLSHFLRCPSELSETHISEVKLKDREIILDNKSSLHIIVTLANPWYDKFKKEVEQTKRIMNIDKIREELKKES